MATPSLAMIPSGYKAQKVYSVLPTNGDGDFTFARSGSATRVNESGLIETVGNNVPRLDYSNGGCPSLLLEPERTNLITYSEDFSQSDWSIFDVSKSANSVVSPDGTLNGARITALSGTNKVFQQLVTVSADPLNNRVFTGSIYIKSSSVTSCFLKVGSPTSINAITISNEWQRFEAQYTLGATFTEVRLGIVLNNEGDEVDVAFGQVEQGSYATSYIPTSGGTVTRLADSCSQTPPDGVIGQTEGTIFVDFIRKPQGNNDTGLFGISSSNNADRVIIWNNFSLNGLGLQIKADESNILLGNPSLGNFDNDENYKIAITYKSGEIKAYVNGSSILNFTNSFTFANDINTIIVNSYQVGINSELSPFKNLKIYNTALTDLELQELTTI